MNASPRNPEATDRRKPSGAGPTIRIPDYRESILATTRSMPVVRYGLAAMVFVAAAIIAWVCLTWLSDAHRSGSLLDSALIGRALTVIAIVGGVVLSVVFVVEFRRLRNRVQDGKGLIDSPAWILGGQPSADEEEPTPASEEADTVFETVEERMATMSEESSGPTEQLAERIAKLHDEAAHRIQSFNTDLEQLFPRWQQRIQAYEDRVDDLERELAAKESENGELVQKQIELVKQHLEIAREKVVDEQRQEIEDGCVLNKTMPLEEDCLLKTGTLYEQVATGSVHAEAQQALTAFQQETAGLDDKERIKAFERRIAEMESALAGADAENRELSWNQLQIMQSAVELLRSENKAGFGKAAGAAAGSGKGFHTEIRRRAALRVAELNERIARMHPEYEDRLSAYEDRLRRMEDELRSKDAENEELTRCQLEMSQAYVKLLKGDPGMQEPGPNTSETLNKLFSLQFDLNDVQQEAAKQVAAFNTRLQSVNPTQDEEMRAYKSRIAELEAEVELKDAENKDLYEAQLELVRHHLDLLGSTGEPAELTIFAEREAPVDEQGLPLVRIPAYQRAIVKDELPREIKALLDRKPSALRIRRETTKAERISGAA